MTHDEAFLKDICTNPDDDAPRLIYADWLDEHGQPERAEFIRTQCELARLAENDERRSALAARELELLVAHRAEWSAPLTGWGAEKSVFRCGFVEFVMMTGENF